MYNPIYTNNQWFVSHQISYLKYRLYLKDSHLFPSNVCYYFLRILLIQTCSIQDILLYLPTETYKSGNNVHFKIHNTFNLDNSTDWELSADLKSQTAFIILSPVSNAESISTNDVSVYTGIGSNSTGSKLCALGYTPIINDGAIWDTTHGAYGSGYHSVKITKIGNKYTYYYDGSEITNTTSNDFTNQTPLYPYLRLAGNANIYIKNVKVKQL